MSTIKTTVRKISKIKIHPNADTLELAEIDGWQVCVRKGEYKEGDLVLYFEQNSVLPVSVADAFGVTKHLSPKIDINGQRALVVSKVRLRGEPSFGLAVKAGSCRSLGDDLTEYFGVTKYRPPIRATADDAIEDHPMFPAYTEIENLRNFHNELAEGEHVVATEKIDGANCRVGYAIENGDPVFFAGSRTLNRRSPQNLESNTYWFPHTIPAVKNLLRYLIGRRHKQAVLYGEVFGKGIQKFNYGQDRPLFRVFDLMIDGKYVDFDQMEMLCHSFQVGMVPIAFAGPYSLEEIKKASNGHSLVGGSHGKEGVVVRPVKERTSPKIGRVVLKYVGDQYLFGESAKNDTSDI